MQKPLMTLHATCFVVGAAWHPQNVTLLVTACERGVLQLWNLLKDSEVALEGRRDV